MMFSDIGDRALTALVICEAVELFFVAPLSGSGTGALPLLLAVLLINGAAALAVVWSVRASVIAVVLAIATESAAVVLRIVRPTERTETLDFAAAFVVLVAVTVVVGFKVFGTGRVTVHRILGAVAVYLNIAAAFALAYRVIDALGPGRFGSALSAPSHHSIADMVYFSFTTLTTTGYGDIVAIDPLARGLSNMESVIGQLFPATLLARLITLHLADRPIE
jgi:hypothetical protein